MKKALTRQNLKSFDKSDMLNLLLDFPLQCRAAIEIAEKARVLFEKRDFKNIVFLGLGGSAVGSDLVKSYVYYENRLPVNVFREYALPAYIDDSTLVFACSYSGNTEETLSAYAQAKKRGASLITISSGGAIKECALKDNITFIEIPKGLPPRCALGYLSIIPLCILAKLGLIKDVGPDLNQAIRVLEELRDKNLNPGVGVKDNIAKYIASKLFNKIAVIYSASINFDVCATRMRGQLAENSKALAWSHFFPEMNHNEIVGWQNPKKIFKDLMVLMLRDKEMQPRVAKRMDVTCDILKKEGVKILEIWSRGEGLLSRIFSLIYIGDFISYYLAILYGIDPTPVEKVTYLKKELAKI
ncbi:MAG: bifunctional phosphoglucose/phosphomannose isomerase [Candidatus Omnitrophica bacterium]|nr:bifunctional phosphoglucose/phosphomannose isomerase [Candidatus Omnitrophota bacterium]MDD5238555.1 bifunctional phosphoglucose/phosphomannose isomerase [Candidatus Omnitrophota bacterium]